MMQQIQAAYNRYTWLKLSVFGALIGSGALLFWLAGGFPPWAWRFLWQTLPQVPQLWALRGPAVISPLAGLVLLSIALLLMWVIITIAAIRAGKAWWQDVQQRSMAQQSQPAEQMDRRQQSKKQQDFYAQETQSMPQQSIHMHVPRQATYALRNVNFTAEAEMPLQAAVPSYARPPESRMPAAKSPNAMREQLRVIRPTPAHMQQHVAELEEDEAVEFDIAEHETRPVSTEDLAEEDSPEVTEDLRPHALSAKLAQAQCDTEGLDSSGKLLEALQPGSNEIRLLVGVGLDPGIARRHAPNEDTLLAIQGTHTTDEGTEPVGLFVIADGMGGHANGQEASRLAIQTLSDVVVPVLMRGSESGDFMELLKDGVHRANLAIYQRNRHQSNMMGTTLTAALVVAGTAYVVNIGDSRTYRYRKGAGLAPVTRDHSIVARLVEHGELTRDEIYTHPKRNQIYRCLGDHATVDIDTFVVPLQIGDTLLLCSDGLWEMVRDPDIQNIIASATRHPSQMSSMLVQAALSRGGADNISVVVVHIARAERDQ